MTFLNKSTKYLEVVLLKNKTEILKAFNKFLIKAKWQSNKKLKIYWTNNGTEFNYIIKMCQNNNIIYEKTVLYIYK